ncbi:methyltransferase [Chloropicon primus]|uniref:tRNA N(3)-methylcytidine methyltransferase n=2 Tax=Chloropicon primus TaxID=1764295 RepID=A0A5B8MS30_9CHLO|nr:methyltransferase [Chloropicon primus]UPR02488.1 methyltransferase [Chloropicon primus]|eukprot:QDZ23276.1 methyltransferase [Chloropicon primus]
MSSPLKEEEEEEEEDAGRRQRMERYTSRSGYDGGRKGNLASEYHDSDFDWMELREEAEKILSSKEEGNHERERGGDDEKDGGIEKLGDQGKAWEKFHNKVNSTAKFFKEKRYILQEFPALLEENVLEVCEFGCGNGSTVIPILKGNPLARVTAMDFSESAVEHTRQAVEREGFESARCTVMTRDLSSGVVVEEEGGSGEEGKFDAVLMVFFLSAVPPPKMDKAIGNALHLLKPGGRVFFRDYGMFDLTQLRFPQDQKLGSKLYHRGDNTLSYFFTLEDLAAKFEGEGFETVETDYACVELYNRKKDFEMRRVFAHGVFRKPLR